MNLLNLIPKSVLAVMIGCLLVLQGITLFKLSDAKLEAAHATAAASALSVRVEHERAESAAILARTQEEYRKREQDLQKTADQLRTRKDAEITRLRNDVRDLRYGLQYLPARPTSGPAAALALSGQAPAGCPGPVLYREIGEDLVSEAERAETIRLELVRLYDLWDKAGSMTAPR